MSDNYLLAAKAVWDNLPLTNKNFAPESVNDCAKMMAALVKKNHMSENWINSVAKAQRANQPIYIDCNNEWLWNFLTMASGTREELLDEIAKLDVKKMRFNK